MGQIANQMALELFFRIKERIKEKKKQKKKRSRLPLFGTAVYATTGSVCDSSVKPAACKKSPLIEEMPDRAEESFVPLEKGDVSVS